MKKIVIFLTCLLCLTLLIVSCDNSKNESESTTAAPTGTGDVDWSDIVDGSDTTTEESKEAVSYEVGEDTEEGFGPLTPFG